MQGAHHLKESDDFARGADGEERGRLEGDQREEAYQGEPPANRIDIVCECARTTCDAAIDITLDEYEHVRTDALRFVILPEHFVDDIERIVFENDRFAVVAFVGEAQHHALTLRSSSQRRTGLAVEAAIPHPW